MFFKGTLQEGIANAVQEAKMVVCFVTDEGDESTKWEKDFLTDDSVTEALSTQSVALRLIAGSEEAKYLAAIFPLPKTPTLVLIRNGELKEYIASGVTREDFLERLKKALGVASSEPTVQLPRGVPSSTPSDSAAQAGNQNGTGRLRTQQPRAQQPAAAPASQGQDKGKGRAQPAPAEDSSLAGQTQAEVQKAAELVKKRKQEANEERRRILEQIEHDRAERKAREEERRAERRALREGVDVSTSGPAAAAVGSKPAQGKAQGKAQSETCALQVRDFDGSTIRTKLPSSGTLRKDVREWVDANRTQGSNSPYLFKLVLTPLPNRTIDDAEEDKTLLELELAPSATLILVPVPRSSYAYQGGSAGNQAGGRGPLGPVGRFFDMILAFIGFVLGIFGRLVSGPAQARQAEPGTEMGPRDQEQDRQGQGTATGRRSPLGGARSRPENSRVSGFRNPDDDRRDQQLYNGNSLNFEPRPDEE